MERCPNCKSDNLELETLCFVNGGEDGDVEIRSGHCLDCGKRIDSRHIEYECENCKEVASQYKLVDESFREGISHFLNFEGTCKKCGNRVKHNVETNISTNCFECGEEDEDNCLRCTSTGEKDEDEYENDIEDKENILDDIGDEDMEVDAYSFDSFITDTFKRSFCTDDELKELKAEYIHVNSEKMIILKLWSNYNQKHVFVTMPYEDPSNMTSGKVIYNVDEAQAIKPSRLRQIVALLRQSASEIEEFAEL